MLDELSHSQELLLAREVFGEGFIDSHSAEGPQELPYGQDTFVYPDRGTPVIPRVPSQGQEVQPKAQQVQTTSREQKTNKNGTISHRRLSGNDLLIQESQTEETMIRRNLTTTRSSRGGDGSTMPFQTPSHRSPTVFSHVEDEPFFPVISPNFGTDELFPPTPVPRSGTGNIGGPLYNTDQMQRRLVNFSKGGRGEVPSRSCTSQSNSAPPRNPAVPRGIMKPLKRRMAAEYGMTPEQRSSKRHASDIERHGLGPIIPDSQQSPSKNTKTQPRKSRRISQGQGKALLA